MDHKTQVLVIQFRRSVVAVKGEQAGLLRACGEVVALVFVDALDPLMLDWNEPAAFMSQFSGVILGGSGDFDFDGGRDHDDESRRQSQVFIERLRPLFAYIFEHDVPTFGICYGHQLLGAYAGVIVRHDTTQAKTGSHQVTVVDGQESDPILAGLPHHFFGHYGHKDVLERVPGGAVPILTGGERCLVSGLRYQKHIYSVQFHPELTAATMIDRINSSPGYLPDGIKAEDLFVVDDRSELLLRNFVEKVLLMQ